MLSQFWALHLFDFFRKSMLGDGKEKSHASHLCSHIWLVCCLAHVPSLSVLLFQAAVGMLMHALSTKSGNRTHPSQYFPLWQQGLHKRQKPVHEVPWGVPFENPIEVEDFSTPQKKLGVVFGGDHGGTAN